MKPIHYVQKYNLSKGVNFSHNEFIQDLTTDFLTLLEVGKTNKGEYNLKGFENTVRAIRMKWDGINNKTFGELPEKLWKYFYATVIVKMREELFPDEMARKHQEREDRKRQKAEWAEFERREFGFGDYLFDMFAFLFRNQNTIPSSSFDVLNISHESTEDQVKQSFRELSKKHHPDKGGNPKVFMEIVEAKNKCLTYIKNKQHAK
jgi:hypothetical protein